MKLSACSAAMVALTLLLLGYVQALELSHLPEREQGPERRGLREPGQRPRHHRHQHSAGPNGSAFEPQAVQREIEKLALRTDRLALADRTAAAEVDGALEDVEAALATRVTSDAALEAQIRDVRADLCAKHGFESQERADCEAFMRRACLHHRHGTAQHLRSALAQVPLAADDDQVPVALCRHFFREVAATVSADEEETGTAAPAPELAHAPGAAPELSPSPAGAPSPGPSFGPSPGPSPGPSEAAMLSPRPSPEEEGPWFALNPEEGLRENGVDGPLVDHDDQETQTSDWMREHGPDAGHRTRHEICEDFPDNLWCRLHKAYYKGRGLVSGSDRPSGLDAPVVLRSGSRCTSLALLATGACGVLALHTTATLAP